MYFSTYNVYEENVSEIQSVCEQNTSITIETMECLICWEPSTFTKKIYKLKELVLLPNFCECNGFFHKECFTECIVKMRICPICRKKITCHLDEYIENTELKPKFLFCIIVFYKNRIQLINQVLSCIFFLIIVYIFTSETVTYVVSNNNHNQNDTILNNRNDSHH